MANIKVPELAYFMVKTGANFFVVARHEVCMERRFICIYYAQLHFLSYFYTVSERVIASLKMIITTGATNLFLNRNTVGYVR